MRYAVVSFVALASAAGASAQDTKRDIPYADPARRVMIFSRWTAFAKTSVADAEVWDYRALARSFSAVAAWSSRTASVPAGESP